MPVPGQAPLRWRPLLWLTAGVLLAHLWLLAGGPGGLDNPRTSAAAPSEAAAVRSAPTGQPAPGATTPPAAAPVSISSVRWIVPAAPPLPEPPRSAPAASPRPASPAAAASRPEPADAVPAPSDSDPAPTAALPTQTPVDPLASPPAPVEPPSAAAPDASVAAAAPPPGGGEPTAAAPLPPAQPPGPVDWRYEVTGRAKGLLYSADARLRWQPSGDRYSAELEINAFLLGRRVQTSSGHLNAQGLAPERFGDLRRSTEKATHFDPVGQRIRYSSNAPDSPLLPGAQDRLSVFLQLAALFQARPDGHAAGQTVRLQVAGTGDAEIWSFQVGPEETLALPASSVSARRLTRPPRRAYDSTVDVWLAPTLQHLPVRIRITEHNGDMADLQLRQSPP